MNRRIASLTVALFAVLALLSGWLAIDRLQIDTKAERLVSSDLPYPQQRRHFEQAFPRSGAPLVAVVRGQTPERTEWATDRLAQSLSERGDLFEEVYQPRGDEFFDRNGLLYMPVEELEQLSSRLADAQPLLGRMTAQPTLDGLAALLSDAMVQSADAALLDALIPLFEQMRRTVPGEENGPPREVSWRALILDDENAEAQTLRVVQVWPAPRTERPVSNVEAIEGIRGAARDLGLDEWGVSVRITGSGALEHDELTTAGKGMRVSGPLSVLLVTGLLLYAMRSHALVIASLLTLGVGLLLTLGFATIAVGRLNLISIAFGVLYVGLGADFAIHLSMNIRAHQAEGQAPPAALRSAVRDVAGSLSLCALTTTVGFFAFLPTSFVAVSELGLIAGTGMVINLVTTLLLLPALMAILPSRWRRPGPAPTSPTLLRLLHAPEHYRVPVLLLAGVVALAGLALAPMSRFDPDPLNLRDPDSESVMTLRELHERFGSDQRSVSVIADSADAADELSDRLAVLPMVDRAAWLGSFVPDRQDEKLAIIDDLVLLLGPTLEPPAVPPDASDTQRTIRLLEELTVRLRGTAADAQADPALAAAAGALAQSLQTWLGRAAETDRPCQRLGELHRAWLGTFRLMIDRLSDSLRPDVPITFESLPASLRQRWVNHAGLHRVEAFPVTDLTAKGEMREFVDQVRSIAPGAVGPPVAQIESGDVVVRAFLEALVLATIAIVLISLLFFRSALTVLEVVTPLLIGGLATLGAMVLLREPFNFANVIALPLLLGVGVDSGLHLVHRSKRGTHDRLLESATARGVLYSGLTTIAGFGSLAFSPHPGMASMGLVLSIGMVAILLSTLVVLPALLTFRAPPSGPLRDREVIV